MKIHRLLILAVVMLSSPSHARNLTDNIRELTESGPGYVCQRHGEFQAMREPTGLNCERMTNFGEAESVASTRNAAGWQQGQSSRLLIFGGGVSLFAWVLWTVWHRRKARVIAHPAQAATRVVESIDKASLGAVAALGEITGKAENKAGSLAKAFKQGRDRTKDNES